MLAGFGFGTSVALIRWATSPLRSLKTTKFTFFCKKEHRGIKAKRVLNAELEFPQLLDSSIRPDHLAPPTSTNFYSLLFLLESSGALGEWTSVRTIYNWPLKLVSVAECMRMYGLSYWSHNWHARYVCYCTGRVTLDATRIRWRND